eukprot:COSAG02_NODE_3949_length_5995_cov_2.892809_1_plen_330_part_00
MSAAAAARCEAPCRSVPATTDCHAEYALLLTQVGAEELCTLQVLGITFVASASETRPTSDAADALFVVHRSRLAARCAAANPGPSVSADEASSGAWGGTAIVDATPCPGGGGQVAPALCCDASVAIGLQRGVQVVAAALASQAASDVPGYTPVCIDLSTTSPTLLTAWLLEYPVGYYVAQPAMSNILGGEELVLFSVRAELNAEASQPLWLQLEAPNGPRQPSTLCSFSLPLDLLTKEKFGDAIQAWCGRVGAVLAPPAIDSLDEVTSGSACCVWQSPCVAKAEGTDPRFSEQDEEAMGEVGERALVSQLEQLPWLRIQEGVVLEQVAL